jgi:hypothetical protein
MNRIILQTTEAHNRLSRLADDYGNGLPLPADHLERPVALHLDHGRNYDLAARCIDYGYTSVMIDGFEIAFNDNCAPTRAWWICTCKTAFRLRASWDTSDKTTTRPPHRPSLSLLTPQLLLVKLRWTRLLLQSAQHMVFTKERLGWISEG